MTERLLEQKGNCAMVKGLGTHLMHSIIFVFETNLNIIYTRIHMRVGKSYFVY